MIDNGLANVLTNSWGDTGGDLFDDAATHTAYDDLFELAAATGITVQYSSGDDGDNFALLGVSAPDYPASSPLVTAVGGTSLEINAQGQRVGELGWSTGRSFMCSANLIGDLSGCTASTVGTWLPVTSDGGSGGFTSYYYLQPPYQAGIVPASLSERNSPIFGPVPLRVIPDISLDADPGTGFLIGLTQTFPNGVVQYSETRYGGTSVASPLLAGLVADADQVGGVSLGFLNPLLYSMDTSDPSSILDVVPSPTPVGNFRTDYAGAVGEGLNNGVTYAEGTVESFRELYYGGVESYCDGSGNCATRPQTQSAAPGYDSLTGLGAPGTNFIGTMASFGGLLGIAERRRPDPCEGPAAGCVCGLMASSIVLLRGINLGSCQSHSDAGATCWARGCGIRECPHVRAERQYRARQRPGAGRSRGPRSCALLADRFALDVPVLAEQPLSSRRSSPAIRSPRRRRSIPRRCRSRSAATRSRREVVAALEARATTEREGRRDRPRDLQLASRRDRPLQAGAGDHAARRCGDRAQLDYGYDAPGDGHHRCPLSPNIPTPSSTSSPTRR